MNTHSLATPPGMPAAALPAVTLAGTGITTSALALGCAHLGSALTPLGRSGCVALIEQAFALGVRHFDTASIYGQGDSERHLGEALRGRRSQVCLSSKAGQRLTPAQAVMSGLKVPIRWMAARHGSLRHSLAGARAAGVPRCFEPDFIEQSLHTSLRRLRTDHLDIFYLHSPDAAALHNDALLARVERWREQGLFRAFGVSCDDASVAWKAARLDGVQVVQLALGPASPQAAHHPRTDLLLQTLARRGKHAVLRGVMGGAMGKVMGASADAAPMQGSGPALPVDTLARRFGHTLQLPAFAGLIVGTTRLAHLRDNVLAFQRAAGQAAAAPAAAHAVRHA